MSFFTAFNAPQDFLGKTGRAAAVLAALFVLGAVSCTKETFSGYAFSVIPNELLLNVGGTYKLEAEWPPEGTATLVWSSNSGSATVDSDGLVTGAEFGEAIITVRALNGGGGELASAQCAVTVSEFRITPTSFQLANGASYKLGVEGVPGGTLAIIWSSNSGSATVDSEGNVAGTGLGLAVITARALDADGGELASAQCSVTVAEQTIIPIDFRVIPSSCSLAAGETKQLSANGAPEGTTVEWSSSPTGAATVSAGGVVTAVSAGGATVTAKAKILGVTIATATCAVTVTGGPAGAFAVVPATLSLTEGGTSSLSTANSPSGTTNINWSSNSGSASVDASGVVTAIGAGQATITATAKAGGITLATATCEVTITAAFKINQSGVTLSAYAETSTLTVSNSPLGTTSVAWSSGTPSILAVNSSGVITVLGGPGTVTITANAMPSSGSAPLATATCTVTVSYNALSAPDENATLAILVQSGTTTEVYFNTPTYTPADVISQAIDYAAAGTSAEPSKIKLIAGKTYTVSAAISTGTKKNLQISTYSAGSATIKRSAKNIYMIDHKSGTLVLGDGVTENRLILDGEGGDANLTDYPLLFAQSVNYPSKTSGSVTLKDGIEITGGTKSGVEVRASIYFTDTPMNLYMEGGIVRGNKTSIYGAGIKVNAGATFEKTGGIVYGNDGTPNANTAAGAGSTFGHAVVFYTDNFNDGRQRNTTAGPEVNLDSGDDINWE